MVRGEQFKRGWHFAAFKYVLISLFVSFLIIRVQSLATLGQARSLLLDAKQRGLFEGEEVDFLSRLERLVGLMAGEAYSLMGITVAACGIVLTATILRNRKYELDIATVEAEKETIVERESKLAQVLAELKEKHDELADALDYAEIQKSMQEHASRRFQSLFDGLPVGCMTFDHEGTIYEWNKRMSEIMGIESHYAVLHNIARGMNAEHDPEKVSEVLNRTFELGEATEFDWTFEINDSERTISFLFFPLRNHEGAVLGGIGCAIDVTQDIANERLLADMAGLQSAVLNAAEYSIVWTDKDRTVIGVNRAACEMLGYTTEQMVGNMSISDFHLPTELALRQAEIEAKTGVVIEDLAEVITYWAKLEETEESEWQYLNAHDSTIDVNLSVSCLRDEAGEIRGYLTIAKDITAEKAIEERLELLSMVAEKSMSSVLILDSSGHILFANPMFERTSGFELSAVIGQTPIAFRTGERTDQEDATRLTDAIRRKETAKCDLLLYRADGTEYWSRFSISPVTVESGFCTNIVIIEEDISDQKYAHLQVIQSERRFRDVVEAAGEYIWEVDANFRFTYASPKIKPVLGYEPEEVIGHSPLDFLEKPEVRRVQNLVSASVIDGSPVTNLTLKSIGKDGSTVWQKFNAIPFFDQHGELQGFRGTGLDITEQQNAQDALAAANLRIQRILESINDSFYSLDSEGRFTYINSSAVKNSKALNTDLVGVHIWDMHVEDFWQPVRTLFHQVQESAEPGNIEFFHEPTHTWFEFRVYPNADGGISVFYQDITERVESKQQIESNLAEINEAHLRLEMQQEQLREANEKLMNLASTDGLTGLKNHKTFQEFLADKVTAAELAGIQVGVILMDVDKFKLFNDGFGHLAGDEVLKKVAKTLQECVKEPHMVARYGGEEFVIVGVGLNEDELFDLADECRACIEVQEWKHRQVTASFGVSMWNPSVKDRAEIIQQADEALYAAKEGGRNMVIRYSEMGESKRAA